MGEIFCWVGVVSVGLVVVLFCGVKVNVVVCFWVEVLNILF